MREGDPDQTMAAQPSGPPQGQGTTQRLQSEFLSCPRCSQPFRDPKALPCLHTLCKQCLQDHVHDEMAGGRRSSFTCPVCSAKIFVPDPSKPTSVWAGQFPSNFVIKGMMDAIAAGSPEAASPPGGGGGGGGGGAQGHQRHPLAQAAPPQGQGDSVGLGPRGQQGAPSSPSQSSRGGRIARLGRSGDSGTDFISSKM